MIQTLKMTKMHKIIEELLDKNFYLELFKDQHGEIVYRLQGFYKSSGVDLRIIDDQKLMAYSRYAQMDEIYDFKDLVNLNHRWWKSSKNRFEGWESPEQKWLPYLIEAGLVKESTETKIKYQ